MCAWLKFFDPTGSLSYRVHARATAFFLQNRLNTLRGSETNHRRPEEMPTLEAQWQR